jgi:hypothetical protein
LRHSLQPSLRARDRPHPGRAAVRALSRRKPGPHLSPVLVLPIDGPRLSRLSGNSADITFVVLEKAGTQSKRLKSLGSRFRGNDGLRIGAPSFAMNYSLFRRGSIQYGLPSRTAFFLSATAKQSGPLGARSGRDCFVAQGAPRNDSAVMNGVVSSSKTDDRQCAADLLNATGVRKPGKKEAP